MSEGGEITVEKALVLVFFCLSLVYSVRQIWNNTEKFHVITECSRSDDYDEAVLRIVKLFCFRGENKEVTVVTQMFQGQGWNWAVSAAAAEVVVVAAAYESFHTDL